MQFETILKSVLDVKILKSPLERGFKFPSVPKQCRSFRNLQVGVIYQVERI
jgi:hypothetical protein